MWAMVRAVACGAAMRTQETRDESTVGGRQGACTLGTLQVTLKIRVRRNTVAVGRWTLAARRHRRPLCQHRVGGRTCSRETGEDKLRRGAVRCGVARRCAALRCAHCTATTAAEGLAPALWDAPSQPRWRCTHRRESFSKLAVPVCMTSLLRPLLARTTRALSLPLPLPRRYISRPAYTYTRSTTAAAQYRPMSAEHPAKKINMSTIKIGTHKYAHLQNPRMPLPMAMPSPRMVDAG